MSKHPHKHDHHKQARRGAGNGGAIASRAGIKSVLAAVLLVIGVAAIAGLVWVFVLS